MDEHRAPSPAFPREVDHVVAREVDDVAARAPEPTLARGTIVAADLEGTCTTGEAWRAVARWLGENGRRGRYRRFLLPRVAALPLVRAGLIDRQVFRDRWIRDLAGVLAGLPEATLTEMAEYVVDRDLWPQRRQAVLDELAAAAAGGARIVLASGAYQPVVERFAARLSHPAVAVGTQLAFTEGRSTGRLAGSVGTGSRKVARLAGAAAGAPIATAYGDSEADIPMLESAVAAVAVCPDEALRRVAVARGWRILDA